MEKKIRCIQIGLGPIGNRTTRYLAARRHIDLMGGVDVDPVKVGRDLGELAGIDLLGTLVTDSLDTLLAERPEVAIVTTSSSLDPK